MKVLVGVLTYNSSVKVSELVNELDRLKKMDFASLGLACGIHVFDDGSMDGTVQLLKKTFNQNELSLQKENVGYGANVKSAMQYAIEHKYDFLVIFPGDMQRRSKDVFRLCEAIIVENSDVVAGQPDPKKIKGKMPLGRKLGRFFINRLTGILWNDRLGDSLSGFKIYRVNRCREIIWLCQDRFGYDLDFSFWSYIYGLEVRSIDTFVSYEDHLSTINSTILQGINFVLRVIILGLVQRPIIKLLKISILHKN